MKKRLFPNLTLRVNQSRIRCVLILPLLVFLVLAPASPAFQTQKKIINLSLDPSEESFLELIEVNLQDTPVKCGQPFEADESWLKKLRFKFKNISTKPITFFDLVGGMIEEIDEEPKPGESFKQGKAWHFGKYIEQTKGKIRGISLQPGAITELTYDHAVPFYKNHLENERGRFCILELGPSYIQFQDGTELRSSFIKYISTEK